MADVDLLVIGAGPYGYAAAAHAQARGIVVLLLGAALFVAFLAWRRGNSASGWFLVAWGLLETVTIATAMSPPSLDMSALLVLKVIG